MHLKSRVIFDIPVDNIYSLRLVIQHVNKHLFNNMSIEDKQDKYIVVSPDAGATKRTLKFAQHMQLKYIFFVFYIHEILKKKIQLIVQC